MSEIETLKALLDLGVAVILSLALLLGSRGLWVYGRTHDYIVRMLEARINEITEERNQWQRMALKGTDVAEKAVSVAAVAKGRES